jgi:hypothetical protein
MTEERAGGAFAAMNSLDRLAQLLHVHHTALVPALGGGWEPRPHDLDDSLMGTTVFTIGDPIQALLAIDDDHGVLVCQPSVKWDGVIRALLARGVVHLQAQFPTLDSVAAAINAAVAAERLTFRWCRHCRTLCSPHFMQADDLCMACASRHEGVLY